MIINIYLHSSEQLGAQLVVGFIFVTVLVCLVFLYALPHNMSGNQIDNLANDRLFVIFSSSEQVHMRVLGDSITKNMGSVPGF